MGQVLILRTVAAQPPPRLRSGAHPTRCFICLPPLVFDPPAPAPRGARQRAVPLALLLGQRRRPALCGAI